MNRQEEKSRRGRMVRHPGGSQRGGCSVRRAGGTSCSLLGGVGPRNLVGPDRAFRPVRRKPQHRALEVAGRQIAAIVDVVEFRSPIEHDGRNALSANAGSFRKTVRDQQYLIAHVHDGEKCGIASALSRLFIPHSHL
ncbi:hypothetical protein [Rhizobium leguminosarum]|uniref:hypothetical protein n=1 Tax=Rhizobium leguminosarum TaxID=384 RepID=UPI003F99D122